MPFWRIWRIFGTALTRDLAPQGWGTYSCQGRFWCMLAPRWAWDPLSGAGAAVQVGGGTFLGRRRSISLIATRQLLPSISKTYLALVR
jgi:hypothetical protein